MKQIYVESYCKSGYSRFLKHFNDILNHPRKESIKLRTEIIKFFDDYGALATRRAFGKARSTIFLWKQKLKKSGGKLSALASEDKTPHPQKKENSPLFHPGFYP